MEQPADYKRADFDILRKTGYGIGVHWTDMSFPRKGDRKPLQAAVDAFDVGRFVDQLVEAGAGHLLFTLDHVNHRLACPHPVVDAISPGRTCERDLVMEIADATAAAGIKLMLYYNHGICKDEEWVQAVGARDDDKTRYYENWHAIMRLLGERYGQKAIAWWIDGARIYRQWGNPQWKEMTSTAKAGFPDRLVCYNNALETVASLTPYEDYWAGEAARLNFTPRGKTTPAGLPWYSFVDWHAHHDHGWAGCWGFWHKHWVETDWPVPSVQTTADFYRRFEACGGTVTYNLFIYQDGEIYPQDLEHMRKVRKVLRGKN